MILRPEDVRDILAILDSTAYNAVTVRTDRFEVQLHRSASGWVQQTTPLADPNFLEPPTGAPGPAPAPPPPVADRAQPAPGAEPAQSPATAGNAAAGDGLVAVTAPVVGTFYRTPRPGAPPFVELGDHVEPDTVVGIIETMKLMTSVPAGTTGTVQEICVGNDEFAPQGATLLRIAPA